MVHCGIPDDIPNAKLKSYNGTRLGDVVTYTCVAENNGIDVMVKGACLKNRTWTYPVCKLKISLGM